MSFIDWVVFLGFLTYVVWDGLRRARGARDLESYFAGRRSIPWWAAGLSVMATQASAITVIGTTGQGHEHGMQFVQTYLALPFAMILLCIFLIPLYRSLPIFTAYEYLERRFGPGTRSLASLIFLVSRCLAFGVVIYTPSVVLSTMLNIDSMVAVVFIGLLTTTYTMIGGINAVIWTDVKQMIVIVGGLVAVLVILLIRLLPEMSFFQILDVAGAAGKLNAVEVEPRSLEFLPRWAADAEAGIGEASFWEEKYNLWSGLFGGLFLMLAYFGCDQSQVQRILTNPTVRESRLALLMSAFAKVPMQVGVLFIGVLLYVFYAFVGSPLLFMPAHQAEADRPENVAAFQVLEDRYEEATDARRELMLELAGVEGGPRSDPELLGRYQQIVREVADIRVEARTMVSPGGVDQDDVNYIFPRFILDNLPPVLLGLVIAAIFAAVMSSADSALNSLTAATVVDFYKKWIRPDATERESIIASRISTVLWGTLATLFALAVEGSGSVIEFVNRVGSFFYGSLLGVFAMALFVPRAGGTAAFCGLLGGMASVLLVNQLIVVEFLWYNVIGCIGVLVTGGAIALVRPRR